MKKDITPLDENGNGHGYWETYYANGNLFSKGSYIHGKEYGYWEGYWSNGQLQYKGCYIDGYPHGYWEKYYINGEILVDGYHFKNESIIYPYQTAKNKFII